MDFTCCFNTYHESLLRYACNVCKDSDNAKDLVQEVFLKLLLRKEKLHEIQNLQAYLVTMVRNEIADQQRKNKLRKRLLSDQHRRSQHYEMPDPLLEKECHTSLHRAIQKLPPMRKMIYQLSCEGGYKTQEIAATLNISPRTVEGQLQQARTKIKAYIHQRLVA